MSAAERWIAPDGVTVEVISLYLCADPGDDGEWYLARLPGGRSLSIPGNSRGMVRTPGELTALGIDLATLTPVSELRKAAA